MLAHAAVRVLQGRQVPTRSPAQMFASVLSACIQTLYLVQQTLALKINPSLQTVSVGWGAQVSSQPVENPGY